MIDLAKLAKEKNVFRFFSTHLSYPMESPFLNKTVEDDVPLTHPSYKHLSVYWNLMKEKSIEQLQMKYTETFDFQEDATLFMTYVKFQDSKERGQMLARLKVLYEMFGLTMPDGELPDLLPLMCEFIYAADWVGDPRAQRSFSLLLAVLEDGTYHLMNALKKYSSPYEHVIRGLRETCKACLMKGEVTIND